MTPHAFYKGPLRGMWPQSVEPRTLCGYPKCSKPFTPDGTEYCSDRCAEDHDTVQKGGTPIPEHERCDCLAGNPPFSAGPHLPDCPRYVPHPEDYSHPLENT